MNTKSVSYNAVKNQEPMNGYPKGVVNGVNRMSNEENLRYFTHGLVEQYALYACDQFELILEKLPEDEQNELVALYIESIDREIEWACYGDDESMNSSFLCAMLKMLKEDSNKNREDFAQTTKRNLIEYYRPSLQKLLNDACEDYQCAQLNEQGYHSQRDLENGDINWERY